MVVKEYNENAGGSRNPMRAVETRKSLYIFNPWSNGTRMMATATAGTPTYRRMAELAKTDPDLAARHELYQHRVVEEFYDVPRSRLPGQPDRRALACGRTAKAAWGAGKLDGRNRQPVARGVPPPRRRGFSRGLRPGQREKGRGPQGRKKKAAEPGE